MTVLHESWIPCGYPVNSLRVSGSPSVYAGLMRKSIFADKYADTFAVNSLFGA